jgi:hypothetical protein
MRVDSVVVNSVVVGQQESLDSVVVERRSGEPPGSGQVSAMGTVLARVWTVAIAVQQTKRRVHRISPTMRCCH